MLAVSLARSAVSTAAPWPRDIMKLVLGMLVAGSMATACGGQISETRGDGGGMRDSGTKDAALDAGFRVHAQWLEYCVAMASCNALYPGGAGAIPNPTTACISSEFDSVTGEPYALPQAENCILKAGASCDKVRACLNEGNEDLACSLEAGVPAECRGQFQL
jgi:hypothetical protein